MPWSAEAENLIAPNGDVFVQTSPEATLSILAGIKEKDDRIAELEAKQKDKWFELRAEAQASVDADSANFLKKQDAIAKDKRSRPQG